MEQNYDFRKRLWQVHKPFRRDRNRKCQCYEIEIDDKWKIGGVDGRVIQNAISDFQDYLWVSMGVSAGRTLTEEDYVIWLSLDSSLGHSMEIIVEEKNIRIRLSEDAYAFRAIVYLEDLMNLEGAPVISIGKRKRTPVFESISAHSASGLDFYPDEELRAMIHAGYDTAVLFVRDIDLTTRGYCDIHDVIHRAAGYGIKVLLYSYLQAFVHPDDPEADQVFQRVFGGLFQRYPDAYGIMLCGETLEFPSRDPHTTGKKYTESVTDGIPETKPSPGWYPCSDYPAYLQKIEKAIHSVKPDARIIFSTYNWAYESDEVREHFLASLPKGIDITITYEIQSRRTLENMRTPVMDYTISCDRPSEYFITEAGYCRKNHIDIQGNVNTAGVAWDFGCIPYVPAPFKLIERIKTLKNLSRELGITTIYATHHYGYWDSFASDLQKRSFWCEFDPVYPELLQRIAIRDYGRKNAENVLSAWRAWSDAMNFYIASNEDQYGPWRVGPAYPFIFHPNITRTMQSKEIKFPTAPSAYNGYKIIKTLYTPFENENQAPGFLRIPAEIRSLQKMCRHWEEGLGFLQACDASENIQMLQALAEFILTEIKTTIHIKQWWKGNVRLEDSDSPAEAEEILIGLKELLTEESENVCSAYPAVETDSRIGWEPSMEYVCDKWHLDWKMRQLKSANYEIDRFRTILRHAFADQK